MGFILCSSAIVICLVSQASSQPRPKPVVEWSPDRPTMYPNPWVNYADCKTSESSGLCDVNELLTVEQRNETGNMLQFNNVKTSVYQGPCTPDKINVTVAIMKQIGPHIHDYRAASREFAQKFRDLWKLGNCSVILIASKDDNTSFFEAGSAVKELLGSNKTEEIDRETYENYFKKGLFVEGLNKTVIQYRQALEAAEETTTSPGEPSEPSATPVIVGVIIGVLVVSIIVITIVIISKLHKKKARKLPVKEEEHLNPPKAV